MRFLRDIVQALAALPRLAKIAIGLGIAMEFIVITQWERLTLRKPPAPIVEISTLNSQQGSDNSHERSADAPSESTVKTPPKSMERFTIEEPLVQPNGTILGNHQTIYLYGIKPIDSKAVCTKASGDRWACGLNFYATLRNSIAKKTITCDPKEILPRGVAAVCRLGTYDLGLALVRDGMVEADDAVADPEMIKAQQVAKNNRLGIWDR